MLNQEISLNFSRTIVINYKLTKYRDQIIRRSDLIAISIAIVTFIGKSLGLVSHKVCGRLWLASAAYIMLFGFIIYKTPTKQSTAKNKFFAIIYGISLGLGFLEILAETQGKYANAKVLALPNLAFLLLISWQLFINSKRGETIELNYRLALMIKSIVIIAIGIVLLILPNYYRFKYINRDVPWCYNRALATDYFQESLKLSKEDKYKAALDLANKCIASCKIGYLDSSDYNWAFEASCRAYVGLIKTENIAKNNLNTLGYLSKLIKTAKLAFGDSSVETASALSLAAFTYQEAELYPISDSIYDKSLKVYKKAYGFKNIVYANTLQDLANSLISRGYYKEALAFFPYIITYIKNDTANYKANGNNKKSLFIGENALPFTFSILANLYSKLNNYDSADFYFNKALAFESFHSTTKYVGSLYNFAEHNKNKGNNLLAKSTYIKLLKIAEDLNGKTSEAFVNALYMDIPEHVDPLNGV